MDIVHCTFCTLQQGERKLPVQAYKSKSKRVRDKKVYLSYLGGSLLLLAENIANQDFYITKKRYPMKIFFKDLIYL